MFSRDRMTETVCDKFEEEWVLFLIGKFKGILIILHRRKYE